MVKIQLKHLRNKYDFYKLKLFCGWQWKNSSLWHCVFWSVVHISVEGGSGPCVMLCCVSQPAEYMTSTTEPTTDCVTL
jgi:hypothetical protein